MNKLKLSDQELFEILKRFDPDYKAEIVRVNISNTFLVRSRCIECGGYPIYYYKIVCRHIWKNISDALIVSKWFRKFWQRMTQDWYLSKQPKYFHDIAPFNIIIEDKSFNPAIYKVRGKATKENENVLELIGCNCGATGWAFNEKSTKKRPVITNRKGRYKYPWGFDF